MVLSSASVRSSARLSPKSFDFFGGVGVPTVIWTLPSASGICVVPVAVSKAGAVSSEVVTVTFPIVMSSSLRPLPYKCSRHFTFIISSAEKHWITVAGSVQ
jgi:hypothetical protein